MSTPQAAALPGEEGRGVLGRITVEVYWVVMLTVLFGAACLPGAAVVLLMEPGRPALTLLLLAVLPVGPALAATVFAWRHRDRSEDPTPWRCFVTGYRLSGLDALKVWAVACLALGVIGTGVLATAWGLAPTAHLVVLAVIGLVVLLSTVHALVITAVFSFRLRDVIRLAVFHSFRVPRVTLAVLALLIAAVALVVTVGDWVVLLAAGVWTRVLAHYEQPLVDRIRTEFTTEQPV